MDTKQEETVKTEEKAQVEAPVTEAPAEAKPAEEAPKAEKPAKKPAEFHAPPPAAVEEPKRVAPPNAKWFVVHTYSGHENKVSANLKQRIETMKLQDKIFDIVVPTRNIVTVKHGKKEEQKEKIFPGYILVKMVLDDTSWLAVRTTQGVTAFVGVGNKPTPISEAEVATILKFMQMEAPKYKTTFSLGEAVKIVDGPFADFLGSIDAIDEEKGKIKVLVSIFGRETPVELDFLQVSKL
jgi:transcription termination/antitermination protein NusG